MAELAPNALIFLNDYVDEVMPCAPTLEAWAAWLAEPDPEWSRNAAAPDGEEFAAHSLLELGFIEARHDGAGWTFKPEPPAEADEFFCRSTDHSGSTPTSALKHSDLTDVEQLACVKRGSRYRVRFEAATAERPARCVVVAMVQ